jgi:hypothetical protein
MGKVKKQARPSQPEVVAKEEEVVPVVEEEEEEEEEVEENNDIAFEDLEEKPDFFATEGVTTFEELDLSEATHTALKTMGHSRMTIIQVGYKYSTIWVCLTFRSCCVIPRSSCF